MTDRKACEMRSLLGEGESDDVIRSDCHRPVTLASVWVWLGVLRGEDHAPWPCQVPATGCCSETETSARHKQGLTRNFSKCHQQASRRQRTTRQHL